MPSGIRGESIGTLLTALLVVASVSGLGACGSSTSTNYHGHQARLSPSRAKLRQRRREARRRQRARTRAEDRAQARARARRTAARRQQLAALGCPDPSPVLAGVYHPDCLAV